jgi:hypothetical protein
LLKKCLKDLILQIDAWKKEETSFEPSAYIKDKLSKTRAKLALYNNTTTSAISNSEINREIEMENSLNPKSQLSILAAEITKGMKFYKIGLRIKEKMITKEPKFKILFACKEYVYNMLITTTSNIEIASSLVLLIWVYDCSFFSFFSFRIFIFIMEIIDLTNDNDDTSSLPYTAPAKASYDKKNLSKG